jgi:hypothetical protein
MEKCGCFAGMFRTDQIALFSFDDEPQPNEEAVSPNA